MASAIECRICRETLDGSKFHILKNCVHQSNFCKKCLVSHIHMEIGLKGKESRLRIYYNLIKQAATCPFPGCGKQIDPEDIKELSPQEFARQQDLQFKKFLRSLPDFMWCSQPDCGSGQEVEGGSSNSFFSCIGCKRKTCFKHKVPFHSGITCQEYDVWKSSTEHNATINYFAQNVKKCPKCSSPSIKDPEGCNHVTCSTCSYEYCWLCLADFNNIRKEGNHMHKTTCQFYAVWNG